MVVGVPLNIALLLNRAKVFDRYVDILRSVKLSEIASLVETAIKLHPFLKFTKELEIERALPFLDMLATRPNGRLQTPWYSKPTDTGLSLSYLAVALNKYKRNIVEGTIHRIHHAMSTWESFNDGLEKATANWEANQYPPSFYSPIVRATVEKLLETRVNTL